MADSNHFQTPFFIGFFLLVLGLIAIVFIPYLGALVLAVTFAVIFHPIYDVLLKHMPRHAGLSAFLTVIVAIAAVLAPLTFFTFQIFGEAQDLYAQIVSGGGRDFFGGFIQKQIDAVSPGFSIDIIEASREILQILLQNLGSIFSQVVGVIATFFLALFALYYLLKDGVHVRGALMRVSPLDEQNTALILKKLHAMADAVIKGSLAIAIVQGILVGIGFLLFGLPNPVLWGSVSILAALIPVIGSGLVIAPAALYLLTIGEIFPALGIFLWGICIVGVIDNILRPIIIEHGVKIHPFLVLLSVLGGLKLFGPMGFLLGPLVLSLLLTLLDIYPVLALKREHINREQ